MMRSAIRKLVVAAACLAASVQALAEARWGWTFDQPSLGVVAADQTLYSTITIFNSFTSSENFFLDYLTIEHQRSDTNPNTTYTVELGDSASGTSAFWSQHESLKTVGLAPGQSITLDAFSLTPMANKVIADNYSLEMTVVSAGKREVYNQLRWQVAAVPEPETYAMMLGGLGLIGALARRRARQAKA